MATKRKASKRLVSAKEIMRYLKDAHGIELKRTALWKVMVREGPSRFPAEHANYLGGAVRVIAETANIDAWVRIHACVPCDPGK